MVQMTYADILNTKSIVVMHSRTLAYVISQSKLTLRINSLKTMYQIYLKFSVHALAMLTCSLKQEN